MGSNHEHLANAVEMLLNHVDMRSDDRAGIVAQLTLARKVDSAPAGKPAAGGRPEKADSPDEIQAATEMLNWLDDRDNLSEWESGFVSSLRDGLEKYDCLTKRQQAKLQEVFDRCGGPPF